MSNSIPIVDGRSQGIQSAGNDLPDMSDALGNYLQDMSFTTAGKVVNGVFELLENQTVVPFKGAKQPYQPSKLELERIGERPWPWFMIHSLNSLPLSPDDVITIAGQNYRVMEILDYNEYSYLQYKIVSDFQ